MKPFSPIFGLPVGISMSFWIVMGLLRLISNRIPAKYKKKKRKLIYKVSDIAVVVAAHNEELVIRRCINALKKSIPEKQIHVISDGSHDKTYRLARLEKVHVLKLNPGKGKAKALKHLFKTHNLFTRYKLIFIVDSDTQIDKNFITEAFKLFENPEIGIVFGRVGLKWNHPKKPTLAYYFISYRERLNKFLQYCFTYGQTWLPVNTNYVIPGFATIYKSSILRQVDIDTPGLLIEDFNLAFQVYKRKLCKVGYSPSMIGWDQHPDNLRDYWKQVRRWNIGFFQTVKINGIWPSLFWLTLAIFSLEVFLNSIFTLLLPFAIFFLLLPKFMHLHPILIQIYDLYMVVDLFHYLNLRSILIMVFLVDYIWTIALGLINKKPQFIIYGPFFYIMHFITSLIFISSLIPGFLGKSDGKWVSPRRQVVKI